MGTDLLLGPDCPGNCRGGVGHLHGPQQHLCRRHGQPLLPHGPGLKRHHLL